MRTDPSPEDECGREGGDALASAGDPEAVGGRRGEAHRRADGPLHILVTGFTNAVIDNFLDKIVTLQDELGVVLVEKSGRGVRLTEAGLAMAGAAVFVLRSAAKLAR